MADSLTSWLLSTVTRAVTQNARQAHEQQGSNDAAFLKGSKVQIIRFLGFGANGQRLQLGRDDDDHGEDAAGQTGAQDTTAHTTAALWAIVGDRTSWVCVKFSKECVSWFDGVHTRPLLSLRGSIFALRWFRPAVSLYAARMHGAETEAAYSGPFAAASSSDATTKLLPRLYLDVQTIHLWGSINETIFHETLDLQLQLLRFEEQSQESDQNGLSTAERETQVWFVAMRKGAQRRAARQTRRAKDVAATPSRTDGTSKNNPALGTSDESSQLDSFPSIVSLPPAFQRPDALKRKRPIEAESELKRAKESAGSSSRSANDGWDSAERKWADEGDILAPQIASVSDQGASGSESSFTMGIGNHAASPLDLLPMSSNDARDEPLAGWRMSDDVAQHEAEDRSASEVGPQAAIESDSSRTLTEEWSQNSTREVADTSAQVVTEVGSQKGRDDADGGQAEQSTADKTQNKAEEGVEWNELVDLPED